MERYFGKRLKQLREDRRWSQKDLSSRLNKGVSTISGYESDAHPIPLDVLISMASIFNISLDELIGIEKPDSMSLGGLSESQVLILKSLKMEFQSPTNQSSDLSESQMKILHDIIKLFAGT